MKKIRTAKRLCLLLPLLLILFLCNRTLSAYHDPKIIKIECPTATDRLGHTMPAYERSKMVGVYLIKYCDGSVRLDTITEPLKIK